jgi:hypothetical protein
MWPAGRPSSIRSRTASTTTADSSPSPCRHRNRCRRTRGQQCTERDRQQAAEGNSLHDSSPFLINGFVCAGTSSGGIAFIRGGGSDAGSTAKQLFSRRGQVRDRRITRPGGNCRLKQNPRHVAPEHIAIRPRNVAPVVDEARRQASPQRELAVAKPREPGRRRGPTPARGREPATAIRSRARQAR